MINYTVVANTFLLPNIKRPQNKADDGPRILNISGHLLSELYSIVSTHKKKYKEDKVCSFKSLLLSQRLKAHP